MIPRQAAVRIQRLLQGFPVVTVTGPRQSGKTTLVRSLLPGRPYVSLESPAQREFAQRRPAEFLQQFPQGAVIDEAQHAPVLFSELQTVVDDSGSTGQQLNMQSLANDVGVSDKTVKHWLSILETCYLIHFVRPHVAHFGKRLTKMPKLYMADVGLAAALLGIRTAEQAHAHPLCGALFETLVVNEFLKVRWNGGDRSMLHYWRDHVGTEVDLVLERGNELAAVEIKSGITVASDAFQSLRSWNKYATQRGSFDAVHLGLVYGGDSTFVREGVSVLPWAQL